MNREKRAARARKKVRVNRLIRAGLNDGIRTGGRKGQSLIGAASNAAAIAMSRKGGLTGWLQRLFYK